MTSPTQQEIEDQIRKGIEAVDNRVPIGKQELSLNELLRLIETAIGYGSVIYNQGTALIPLLKQQDLAAENNISKEQLEIILMMEKCFSGCAQIYVHTAHSIAKFGENISGNLEPPEEPGFRLAVQWLKHILEQNSNGNSSNELAWELRYAFDAIVHIGLLQQIDSLASGILRGGENTARGAGEATIKATLQGVDKLLEDSEHELPVAAYILRHTSYRIVALLNQRFPANDPQDSFLLSARTHLLNILVTSNQITQKNVEHYYKYTYEEFLKLSKLSSKTGRGDSSNLEKNSKNDWRVSLINLFRQHPWSIVLISLIALALLILVALDRITIPGILEPQTESSDKKIKVNLFCTWKSQGKLTKPIESAAVTASSMRNGEPITLLGQSIDSDGRISFEMKKGDLVGVIVRHPNIQDSQIKIPNIGITESDIELKKLNYTVRRDNCFFDWKEAS